VPSQHEALIFPGSDGAYCDVRALQVLRWRYRGVESGGGRVKLPDETRPPPLPTPDIANTKTIVCVWYIGTFDSFQFILSTINEKLQQQGLCFRPGSEQIRRPGERMRSRIGSTKITIKNTAVVAINSNCRVAASCPIYKEYKGA
jgi:hypothetical protein